MTQKRTSRPLRNKYRLLLRTSIIIHPENAIALIRNLRHSFSHVALVAHRDPGPIDAQAAQCTCALRLFAKARWCDEYVPCSASLVYDHHELYQSRLW